MWWISDNQILSTYGFDSLCRIMQARSNLGWSLVLTVFCLGLVLPINYTQGTNKDKPPFIDGALRGLATTSMANIAAEVGCLLRAGAVVSRALSSALGRNESMFLGVAFFAPYPSHRHLSSTPSPPASDPPSSPRATSSGSTQ